MNKTTSKKLRAIVNPEDPVSRRVYRRLKKQYSKLPKAVRPLFLQQTAEAMGIIQQTIDQSQE
jgi:hypothetical protein